MLELYLGHLGKAILKANNSTAITETYWPSSSEFTNVGLKNEMTQFY